MEVQVPGQGFEERAHSLTNPEEVEAFLAEHPDCVILKAGSCHRTAEAFAALRPLLDPRADVAVALIRVVDARAASRRMAELTGIRHESPQVLLLRGGRVVLARDNWQISTEALAQALLDHFGARAPQATP
jgi:bacillithiol system protein YtxJ